MVKISDVARHAGVSALGVRHLAELGCHNVALLGERPAVYARGAGYAERTLAGFTRALQESGITGTVLPRDPAPDAVGATISRLLREHPGLTGLVVQDEAVVEPMLKAIRTEGRRAPEDVSVIVIGPDELGLRTTPHLPSVSLPADEGPGGRSTCSRPNSTARTSPSPPCSLPG